MTTIRLNTRVKRVEPVNGHWEITTEEGLTEAYKGVIIANGCLSHPNIPEIPGEFTGEIMHSCKYKTAGIFEGKRVLVVGAGNSGCDIVVDAVHRASRVDLSVRRGYHFVPKYVFGRPADTIGGAIRLPAKVKQKIDGWMLNTFFIVDPQKLGFPKPDHKLYESHPIVNTLVLYHLGHGDISIKKDVASFEGKTVHFRDGSSGEYDMVMLATGYKLNYPFIDRRHLNWPEDEKAPQLYLNIFTPQHDNLFVLGMIEATGLGWEGRNKQAELVAHYIRTSRDNPGRARRFHSKFNNGANRLDDLRGGYKYMEVDRMAYYVHKDTYLRKMRRHLKQLN